MSRGTQAELGSTDPLSEGESDLLVYGYDAAKKAGNLAEYMIAMNKTPSGGYSDADIAAARRGG